MFAASAIPQWNIQLAAIIAGTDDLKTGLCSDLNRRNFDPIIISLPLNSLDKLGFGENASILSNCNVGSEVVKSAC